MDHPLWIYNTLTRQKEQFRPLNPPHVGLYVCGPTVYGDPHLGHARPAITFDVLFRYLKYQGYKVRYVRNITDVGHLEADADDGEDKVAKKARLEQLEPMEIAHYYIMRYHRAMDALGVLPPSIEPMASGHVIEQIDLVEKILQAGYAYVSNGSVYFDIEKYNYDYGYGVLSGRNIEDMISNTRTLDGQEEKRSPLDFSLWKAAKPEHIMRWPSPWSDGFPGWHCECTAMGHKYLGDEFDIHGGGMDLVFPHHECEIAQARAMANGRPMVHYWMHNNMITIEGKKMGKSLGNFITLEEFFTGNHPKLHRAFSPMTIRFFILGAHYRGTVDFSNEVLEAASKGLARMMEASAKLNQLKPSDKSSVDVATFSKALSEAMDDDLNTPGVIATLFDMVRIINRLHTGEDLLTVEELEAFRALFRTYLFDLLGIQESTSASESTTQAYTGAVDILLELRQKAKSNKDWATSDLIRDRMAELGFVVKDTKEGVEWSLDE